MSVGAIHKRKQKPPFFQEIELCFKVFNPPLERPLACKLASALAKKGWLTSVIYFEDEKLLTLMVHKKKRLH